MSVRKSAPLVISLVCGFSCMSCVQEVTLDAGEKPAVVVECVLKNSDIQELRLNFTKGASKEESEPLTDAVATLIDLTMKKEAGQFVRKEGDLWTLDYTPVQYHEYRLEVQVPGYDLIYAEETMPGHIEFWWGSANSHWQGLVDYYNDNKVIAFEKAKNKYPESSGHFIFLRGTFYMLGDVSHPFLVYGMNYNPVTEQYEIVEELCTDHPSVLSSTLNGGTYVPPSIIEELPKVQLHPYLEGASLHNRYLIFPKGAHKTEKFFVVSGSFTGRWYNDDLIGPMGYLVFASLSDNYMRYIGEAIQIKSMKESSDMSVIYLRDNVYSNINGGIGLFGGIYEKKTEWLKSYMNMDAWENFWYKYERDPSQFYPWQDSPETFVYHVDDSDGLYKWYESGALTWEEYASIGGI